VSIKVVIGLSKNCIGELLFVHIVMWAIVWRNFLCEYWQYPPHHKAIYHWYHQFSKIYSFPL